MLKTQHKACHCLHGNISQTLIVLIVWFLTKSKFWKSKILSCAMSAIFKPVFVKSLSEMKILQVIYM